MRDGISAKTTDRPINVQYIYEQGVVIKVSKAPPGIFFRWCKALHTPLAGEVEEGIRGTPHPPSVGLCSHGD